MRRPLSAISAAVLMLALVSGCGSARAANVSSSRVHTREAHILGVTEPRPNQYGPIDFFNQRTGWVAESPGSHLLHTVDEGQRWISEALPKGDQAQALDFLSPSRGVVIAYTSSCPSVSAQCDATLLLTTNGGHAWSVAKTVALSSAVDFSPALSSGPGDQSVFALLDGRLYASLNAGATWTRVALPSGMKGLALQAGLSGSLLVGAGVCEHNNGCSNYALLQSTNGGGTWNPVWRGTAPPLSLSPVSSRTWYLLCAPNPGMLSMGGAFGSLYQTTDAGQTWTQLQSPQQWTTHVYGPGFQKAAHWANSRVGWIPVSAGAGGGQGGLEVTQDGGRRWTEIGEKRQWTLSAADLLSPLDGWIAGSTRESPGVPFLLHTINGGKTWQQVQPVVAPTVAISMGSATIGSAMGDASDPSALLATSNGGSNWHPLSGPPLPRGQRIVGYRVLAPGRGTVLVSTSPSASSQGSLTIYATNNGGASWITRGSFSGTDANVFQMTAAGEGLVEFQDPNGQGLLFTRDGGRHLQLSPFHPHLPTQWIPDLAPSGRAYILLSRPLHNRLNKPQWTPVGLQLQALNPMTGSTTPVFTWPNPGGIYVYQPVAIDMLAQGHGFVEAFQLQKTHQTVQKPTGKGSFRTVPKVLLRLLLWWTSDGGKTWTSIQLPTALAPNPQGTPSLNFVDAQTGFILSTNGLFKTVDGGLEWTLASKG